MTLLLIRSGRKALTLVELLVVIVILVLLVAVVLPLAQPTPAVRVVRESARQVNAMLANAQTKATAEGRPYGVVLTPDASGTRCIDLSLAKVPPVYAGDDVGAAATIDTTNSGIATLSDSLRVSWSSLNEPTDQFVGPGDQIRFNYRGSWYSITSVFAANATSPPVINYVVPVGTQGPPVGAVMPFQIQRSPKASSAGTMTLPVGAYVDLAVSGVGATGGLPSTTIMFDTNGKPQWSDSVFLMIGSQELQSGTGPIANWINSARNLFPDVPSVWLTISSAGRISTVENAAQIQLAGNSVTVVQPDGSSEVYDLNNTVRRDEAAVAVVQSARQSARSGPSMGGR